MDQWNTASSYAQPQTGYGQQAGTQQTAYSYPQQAQAQQQPAAAAAPYTYTGTSYGQQEATPASAYTQASAYSQQPYSQQGYGQQAAATTASGQETAAAYGTGGTTVYNTGGTSQQQAAPTQANSWAQNSAVAANQPVAVADVSQAQTYGGTRGAGAGSAAANASSAQYGGQYGSMYGAGATPGSQASAGTEYGTSARGTSAYDSADQSVQQGAAATYGTGTQYDGYGTAVGGQSAYDAPSYGTTASQSGYAKESDQYGAAYGAAKTADYGAVAKAADYGAPAAQQERAAYNQAGYGQETQAQGRYADTSAPVRQQDQQQSLYRQHQTQHTPVQAAAAAIPSAANVRVATQQDYSSGRSAASDYGGPSRQATQVASQGGPYGQAPAAATTAARGSGFPATAVYGALAAAQQQQVAQFAAAAAATRNMAMVQQVQQAAMGAAGRGFGASMGYGQQQQQSGFGASGGGFGGMGGRDYSSGRLSAPTQRDAGFSGPRGGPGAPARGGFDDRSSHRRDMDRGREDDRRRDRFELRDKDRDRDRGDRDRDRERTKDDDRRKEGRDRRESESKDRRDDQPSKRDDRRKEFSPPPKREQRHVSPREREPRRNYLCKIEPFSFTEPVRDYLSTSRRYSKMYVVPEFSKVVACWVGQDLQIAFDKPLSFEHEAVDVEDANATQETPSKSSNSSLAPAKGHTVWSAKVLLMAGVEETALAELERDKASEDKPIHLHNLVKFLAIRKDRNPIMAAGGVWDADLDGGDPASGDEALIRTAIRCTKELTGVDLSACTKWNRFVEIHYERAGDDGSLHHNEVSVMFVPDIWNIVPSLEEWKTQWKEHQVAKKTAEDAKKVKEAKEAKETKEAEEAKEEEEAKEAKIKEAKAKEEKSKETKEGPAQANGDEKPQAKEEVKKVEVKENGGSSKDDIKPKSTVSDAVPAKSESQVAVKEPTLPGLIVTTKRTSSAKMRSMSISLDGLLDYDEEDREDITFELSLFAENFHEYLQTRFGSMILENLKAVRVAGQQKKALEKKRPLEKDGKEAKAEKDKDEVAQTPRKKSRFSDTAEVVKADGEDEKVAEPKAQENGKTEDVKMEEPGEGNEEVKVEAAAEAEEAKDVAMAETGEPEKEVKKEEPAVEGDGEKAKEEVKASAEGADGGQVAAQEQPKEVFEAVAAAATGEEAVEKEKGNENEAGDKEAGAVAPPAVKTEKRLVVNKELLRAYRYFDKNLCNYLKTDDLRRMVHCLQQYSSHKNVKDLVSWAVTESGKSREDRVLYRTFTDKEELVEVASGDVPISGAGGAKAE